MRDPQEVVNDPQLRANDIVVPLEGAGGKLTSTISSPIQVHGVAKAPAGDSPHGGLGAIPPADNTHPGGKMPAPEDLPPAGKKK